MPAAVLHDESSAGVLDRPGRREAAFGQWLLRELATSRGGFNGPHVSPRVGRSGRRFHSTQRSLILRIQLSLFFLFHSGTRGIGVLFIV